VGVRISFTDNFKNSRLKMASKVEVVGDGFDCDEEATFLFTSESVGEGHPGDICRPLCVGCGF